MTRANGFGAPALVIVLVCAASVTPAPCDGETPTGPDTPAGPCQATTPAGRDKPDAPCEEKTPPARDKPERYVYVPHQDESESFDMVLGITGGGGLDSRMPQRPAEYAGIKLGGVCCIRGKHPLEHALTVTLDLGYDRLRSRNGVSGEFSVMIPVLRFPNPGTSETKKFIRVYAEPGAGIRVGGGEFAYYSGKVMIAVMSDRQISAFGGAPIVELQRRFPVTSPRHGDTRVMIGIMHPLCRHCGFD